MNCANHRISIGLSTRQDVCKPRYLYCPLCWIKNCSVHDNQHDFLCIINFIVIRFVGNSFSRPICHIRSNIRCIKCCLIHRVLPSISPKTIMVTNASKDRTIRVFIPERHTITELVRYHIPSTDCVVQIISKLIFKPLYSCHCSGISVNISEMRQRKHIRCRHRIIIASVRFPSRIE